MNQQFVSIKCYLLKFLKLVTFNPDATEKN